MQKVVKKKMTIVNIGKKIVLQGASGPVLLLSYATLFVSQHMDVKWHGEAGNKGLFDSKILE